MRKTMIKIVLPAILMLGCSKSGDKVAIPENAPPTRVELDIATLNIYIGQTFDVVHSALEKSAFQTKTSLGDRYFNISANAGIHDGLTVEIKETNKIINEINVKYDGVVGGDLIGDPYETELWYHMLNKVQSIYGQSSTRIYIKGTASRLLSSNEALIQVVKDSGYKNASYAATWNSTVNVMTVFHSNTGRFLLQIKAK